MIILELSHAIVWLVRHVCFDKAEFSFLQKKTAFGCSFTKQTFGLSDVFVVAIQNSLDGFRNTLNVRNNSKTSRWFPFIKRVTSCNWFLAVTEKGFCIAICL